MCSMIDIISESSTIEFQFRDKRINRRASFMSDSMAKGCQKSLPEIFTNPADLKGAYRFFSNRPLSKDNEGPNMRKSMII